MPNVWMLFHQCGWPSWFSLALGLATSVFSAIVLGVALLRGRAAVLPSWLALAAAFFPVAAGALGMALFRTKVDRLLTSGSLDPSQIERLRAEGYDEAAGCVAIGGAFTALPLLLAGIALAVAYGSRRRDDARAAR